MVRVTLGKNGSIAPRKSKQPKPADSLKKHASKHKHKDKLKAKRLLKLKHKAAKEKAAKELERKHTKKHERDEDSDDIYDMDDNESDDSDIDMDDSFDASSSSSDSGDSGDSSDSSSSREDNPFAHDIDKQLEKKIKPIKSVDVPAKNVKLNMEIVSKDYVDICTQIHTLSKSLKVDKSDKKVIANMIYYYIKYFLYSCCIKKKPVFDWLEEFKDKIHIY